MALSPIAARTAGFAFALHRQIAADQKLNAGGPKNSFVSPVNHQNLWLATAQATEGETRREMLAATGFPGDAVSGGRDEQMAFGQAVRALQVSVTGPNTLRMASSLWVQEGPQWTPNPAMVRFLQDTADASVHSVNFAGDPEAARALYNKWGARATDDMVKEALQKGDVSVDTRLINGSAFLAAASWEEGFAKGQDQNGQPNTRPSYFRLTSGEYAMHPTMMHKTSNNTRLFQSWQDGVTLGVLPYVGADLSMVVLTSQDPSQFTQLEDGLTLPQFEEWLGRAQLESELDVEMPKFEFETHIKLNDVYQRLGIQTVYGGRADYSGIFPGIELGALFLDSTISAAKVVNDEDGTRVAEVVTNVSSMESTMARGLMLNGPFVYVIYSNTHGPIGIGRYVQPPAEEMVEPGSDDMRAGTPE